MQEELFTTLKELDYSGKIIRPFTTYVGSGLSLVSRQLKEICAHVEVLDGWGIVGLEVKNSKQKVEEWI